MPEHETFDLDTAFAHLEQDITTLSSAPGAGAAVARARRRRRTTIASVAAVTALAVGGVVAGPGLGHQDRAVPPSGHAVSLDRLPSPAALNTRTLTASLSPWESGWGFYSIDEQSELYPFAYPSCVVGLGELDGPPPDYFNLPLEGSSGTTIVDVSTYRWDPQLAPAAGHAYAQVTSAFDRCSGARRVVTRTWPDGTQSVAWRLPPDGGGPGEVQLWAVHSGRGLVVAFLGNNRRPGDLVAATQSVALPRRLELRFTEALVAGLEARLAR